MKLPTPEMLLSHLPPYRDEWVLIHPDQSVKDIIKEVLEAHADFAPYYDKICSFFSDGDAADISQDLFNFCKKYIHYREETEETQTSALPTGILTRGYGDCKHYAGFIGGMIDALNRSGEKIPWAYAFASYDPADATPHHVFIVVYPGTSREIWVDPTPGSVDKEPIFRLDKKVKPMALHRNIAGTGTHAIGIASLYVNLNTSLARAMQFAGAPWPTATYGEPFPHYLGFDMYQDYGGDRDINETELAARVNAAIQNGPAPGHTVTPDFVKWVYANSIRSWNFYYPSGVDPAFNETKFIPPSFSWVDSAGHRQTITPPHWVVTKDGRVTFDHDQPIDDYQNWLIHILTAAAQKYINQYDAQSYPLKPRDLKLFSQAYTGNPNNPAASILKEWRGTSDVTKVLNATVQFVSNVVLKIIGAIPRNAFLALIGINLFHMATDLQNSINAGHWGAISDRWKSLGGDPSKLQSTIAHGAGQPSTEDTTQTVNSPDQISGANTIGNPAVVAAIIAAATPVIVALASYFTHSSVSGIVQNGVNGYNAANPGAGYHMVNGQLVDANGNPVTYQSDTTGILGAGSIVWPLVAAAGTYVLLNYKKAPGSKKQILIPAAAGVGVYLFQQYKIHNQVSNQPLQPQASALLPQAQQPTGGGALITPLLNAASQIYAATQQGSAQPTTAGAPTDTTPAYQLAGVPYAIGMIDD